MAQQLNPGQQVTVNSYPRKRPTVIVVEDRGDIVMVCKAEEYTAAQAENRQPMAVGFRREDILDVMADAPKKGATSEIGADRRSSMAGD